VLIASIFCEDCQVPTTNNATGSPRLIGVAIKAASPQTIKNHPPIRADQILRSHKESTQSLFAIPQKTMLRVKRNLPEVTNASAALFAKLVVARSSIQQRSAGRELTKFVGREREMEALKHAAEQAKEGRGQIAAAMAEAGVGKSRLFFEFKATSAAGWVGNFLSGEGPNSQITPNRLS
jgi:hypothetical protein